MKIQPYINFYGNCQEAVAFYAKVFKTDKAKIMTYGENASRSELSLIR